MLSSNGTQSTIQYFLNLIKTQSPDVSPSIFMTDRDQAQVNSIRAISLSATTYSIAGGTSSRPSGLISIQTNSRNYGPLSKVGFAQPMTVNSMHTGITLGKIHWSQRAWLNISLGIGSPIRKCGPRCPGKIAQYSRKGILICYWKHMSSLFREKKLLLTKKYKSLATTMC